MWNVAYLDKIGWEDSLPLRVLEAIRSEDILLATIGGIGRVLLLGSPFQLLEYQWGEGRFDTLGLLGSAHRAQGQHP